jgi:hypothetical protein
MTPTTAASAEPTDEQVTAREIARRKQLAAARRARRARAFAAAQPANQNSLFPQTSFSSASAQQPAQQAVGGPFVPASAPAKVHRQN